MRQVENCTTKVAPKDVNDENIAEISQRLVKQTTSKVKYSTGMSVRICRDPKLFEKSHVPKFSDEIFTIVKVQNTNPVTYKLEDVDHEPILGSFYKLLQFYNKHSIITN